MAIIFAIGLCVLLYPYAAQMYYRIDAQRQIADFDTTRKSITQEEIDKRIQLAAAYNASLANTVTDPYGKEQKEAGRAEYARMLEIREKIGHVEIPRINQDLPMYAGTSQEVLEKGVGHLEGTSLPIGGENTHAVLTAHAGYPTARLFTDLKDLKSGDKFYIHNVKTTLAYQVDKISIIEPTDFSQLLISPGHDYVTLLTCTPLYVNSHRLIVRGHRVPYVPNVDEKIIAENRLAYTYKYLFYASLVIISVLVIAVVFLYRRRVALKKHLDLVEKNAQKYDDVSHEAVPEVVTDIVDSPVAVDSAVAEDSPETAGETMTKPVNDDEP
ncbi:class C sortase [Alloscardovia theropitheci]|uniref:Class C sortase n=1 Tax=Alloscardovia theropitheci TaxID=2496842 RepID=A0A4R0QNF3_9BIFI|nr:class C sortase [Alloscardovia theropitheci]TCD53694.1 class C sortase [Alloscardovia theropitheci]